MVRISKHTAKAILPIIKGMGQAGTLPRSEANAAASVLNEASKHQAEPPSSKPKRVMLTTSQVAARLGVCTRTILIMNKAGKIKGTRLTGGRCLRFSESEVERFLNVEA